MRVAALAGTFVFLIAGLALAEPQATAPQVTIPQGTLSGTTDSGISVFKDIPFAAPPVGDLRWRAPQPAPNWSGLRDASKFGPICMQGPRPAGRGAREDLKQSEDCLSLNIWTPNTAPQKKLPVMVWIYGGGFREGGSAVSLYDGTELAQHGVIVVTINYRLGYFGFLDLPSLAAEHPDEPHGNYGLLDQIAALKWVQANIGAFGGDPSNVTIFGESAGGMSVNDLMVSPLARGLFGKAISESGLGLIHTPTEAEAQQHGAAFAARMKADDVTGAEQIKTLRARPAAAIANAEPSDDSGGMGPMVDGTVLPDQVAALFAQGKIADATYMAGSNSNEASLMPNLRMDNTQMFAQLGDKLPAVRAIYESGGKLDDEEFGHQLFDDAVFASGAQGFAHYAAKTGRKGYVYYFGYVADALRGRESGVGHGGELVYVFGLHGLSKTPRGAMMASFATDKDKKTIALVQDYWTNFAKSGDPNGANLPAWPPSTDAAPQTMVFGDDSKAVAGFREKQLGVIYLGWNARTGDSIP